MPTKSGTVLLYNCSGPEYSKMRQIFAMLRLRMRPVGSDRLHLPLADLAAGRGEPSQEPGEPIPEVMLVFCEVNGELLDKVLEILRLSKLPAVPLKAVLTETNQSWNSRQLYDELCKEREAVAAQKEGTS